MIAQFFIEMFQCVTQGHTRHGHGMFIKEFHKLFAVFITCKTQRPAIRLVDQILFIVEHDLRQFERIFHITFADEIQRADNGGATLGIFFDFASLYKTLRGLSIK